jgi:Holliday junction resolvase RusA-like endonuclease
MSHLKMSEEQFAAHVARNKALRVQRSHPEDSQPKPVPALLQRPQTYGQGAIEFTVPGNPVPKGRPRLGKGHTYTPRRTQEAENVVRSVAQLAEVIPLLGPLVMHLDFFCPIPKAWAQGKRQSAMLGTLRPTTGADCDNLGKLILDALQGDGPGSCFQNDASVVELVCRKWYSIEPRTVVKIVPLP